jgi:hypothetical protein
MLKAVQNFGQPFFNIEFSPDWLQNVCITEFSCSKSNPDIFVTCNTTFRTKNSLNLYAWVFKPETL